MSSHQQASAICHLKQAHRTVDHENKNLSFQVLISRPRARNFGAASGSRWSACNSSSKREKPHRPFPSLEDLFLPVQVFWSSQRGGCIACIYLISPSPFLSPGLGQREKQDLQITALTFSPSGKTLKCTVLESHTIRSPASAHTFISSQPRALNQSTSSSLKPCQSSGTEPHSFFLSVE